MTHWGGAVAPQTNKQTNKQTNVLYISSERQALRIIIIIIIIIIIVIIVNEFIPTFLMSIFGTAFPFSSSIRVCTVLSYCVHETRQVSDQCVFP